MNKKEVLTELEKLGNERTRAQNTKQGAGDNQFGVKLGDIRKIAKKIKQDHELAIKLWETGNVDARFLATLIVDPESLSNEEIDQMVRSESFTRVADWFNSYVLKHYPDKETLRKGWMKTEDPMAARAGWSLTAGRIAREPEGLDLTALLDRIESEMGDAAPEAQWTMNTALVEIGINHPEHRERALAIGEKLGVYSDYPERKGCTSPFAPIWINEMVKRQSA